MCIGCRIRWESREGSGCAMPLKHLSELDLRLGGWWQDVESPQGGGLSLVWRHTVLGAGDREKRHGEEAAKQCVC